MEVAICGIDTVGYSWILEQFGCMPYNGKTHTGAGTREAVRA